MTRVSVVLPTFNRRHVLREALDSVLCQSTPARDTEVEVIVVDDGSTDGTREMLAEYGGKVRTVTQPNRGPAGARNTGLEAARGELVSFLDSDDLWRPGKLQNDLEHFERFADADVVIADARQWEDGRVTADSWMACRGVPRPAEPQFLADEPPLWIDFKLFPTSGMTIHRRALERLGPRPFEESLLSCEDWVFEIRLLAGFKVLVLPDVWVEVRRFDDGSRGDRPIPGRRGTPAQERVAVERRLRVFESVPSLKAWPQNTLHKVLAKQVELRAELRRLASGGELADA